MTDACTCGARTILDRVRAVLRDWGAVTPNVWVADRLLADLDRALHGDLA